MFLNRGLLFGLSLLVAGIRACSDSHEHVQHRFSRPTRSASSSNSNASIRSLQWGDVQILHTTDIHGWYQGHTKQTLPEPNYSGDWGDFASFVIHMRRLARRKGVDLLLVDSGDLHDGAGLSDGYTEGQGPDAHVSNEFHSMIEYDALAVGNHELYVYENALDTFKNFAPNQRGRYLSSNVNITHTLADGSTISEPMGSRFVKFKTHNGRRVTSLGVLFDFQMPAKGLTVQAPVEMVKQSWFLDTIQEAPDFFLLVGHMPVRDGDWPVVVDAIRAIHPAVPIVIAGGHTHVRDCLVYDGHAFGIESGRYLETIGWLSFNTTPSTPFSRTYIDANKRNYAFHASLSGPDQLSTHRGRKITAEMDKVAQSWNLTQVYGINPDDYYLARVPWTSPSSILHLLTQKILPTVISTSNTNRTRIPNIIIANSGSQRFDLYKGPFTKNDQYIVSPFDNKFLYFDDVPFRDASKIVHALNMIGESVAIQSPGKEDLQVEAAFHARMKSAAEGFHHASNSTLGYYTKDSCPGIGDDTEHTPVPYIDQPDYVASPLKNNVTAIGPDDTIDVVFFDFSLSGVVQVLNTLQAERVYKAEEAKQYNNITTRDLYRLYATQAWSNQVSGLPLEGEGRG